MRIILLIMVLWVVGLGSYLVYDRYWPGHTGTVVVTSSPPGAEIWVDLAPTGLTTPAELSEVLIGKHSFTVRLEGRRPQPFVKVVEVSRASFDSLAFVFDGDTTARRESDMSMTTPPAKVPPRVESISDRVKRELPDQAERVAPSSVDSATMALAMSPPKTEAPSEQKSILVPEPKTAEPGPVRTPAEVRETVRKDPDTGTIEVSSSLPGARIFINDKQIAERTPATVALPLGTHMIRVEMPGYKAEPEQHDVRLSRIAGGQLVYFTLTEIQRARKEITITTEPPEGAIIVDGDTVGVGLAVVPHEFGVFEIAFGPLEGYLTPETQRVVVTPAKPNLALNIKYARSFHVAATCRGGDNIDKIGDIRWETGLYDRDKGPRISEAHGPKINAIPGSDKSGWELAMGDPNRNPTGSDYIEFFFTLPDEVPPSTPLNLRLYLYRTNRKYPLSLSSRCEITVTVNGRVFLDNFRPRHDQTLADSERFEEWSLQHSLVPGENRIMIRTGDKNQIFNYLWKFEVL